MSECHIALRQFQSFLSTDTLASLGPGPRVNREPLRGLEARLQQSFSENKTPENAQVLIRSLVFLWHDYLDESHSISQDIESVDGSFLHGIMHRREPDYGNAKYWYHRVREHPCFPVLAQKVETHLTSAGAWPLKSKLIHEGVWDAFAFVDACEMALLKNDAANVRLLEQVQQIEFATLLEHFVNPIQ